MIENTFFSLLNEKTCYKYEFLKLKQVFFDVNSNKCNIYLIYPFNVELSDEQKNEILSCIKDILNLKGTKLVVNISKSFVEDDLVKSVVLEFFKTKNPLLLNGLDKADSIKIEINNVEGRYSANITLLMEKKLVEYVKNFKIEQELLRFLGKNFCCDFELKIAEKDDEVYDNNFLEKRVDDLQQASELSSMIKFMENKYTVGEKKVVVGSEISFNPKYISSYNQPTDNCVVAGKINFLKEKTFKSKLRKKNADQENEVIDKPFFTFSIQDKTGLLSVVMFPTKAGYHKMHLLSNSAEVIIQGKLEKFNDKLEVVAKNISFCKLINENEQAMYSNADEITAYRFVKPVKYLSKKQANIFDSKDNLSKEILSHSFVVYDFETTGLDASSDEIIEIGALKVTNGVFTDVFTTLVKPSKPIPEEATKINRITNEMVSVAPTISQVLPDFFLFCKDCQMVGYNSIAFDNYFLQKASKKIGLEFNNTQIDVFVLAKEKLSGLKNYKLGSVTKYLDINLIDAHRALNDVIATAEVFLKLY